MNGMIICGTGNASCHECNKVKTGVQFRFQLTPGDDSFLCWEHFRLMQEAMKSSRFEVQRVVEVRSCGCSCHRRSCGCWRGRSCSHSDGLSVGESQGITDTRSESQSRSVTESSGECVTEGRSRSQSHGVSEGESR